MVYMLYPRYLIQNRNYKSKKTKLQKHEDKNIQNAIKISKEKNKKIKQTIN
jgi:hypothetical protein